MYKISVSKAKTYESCHKKFHLNYILKLKQKDFAFFAFGKMLHMTLENFHKTLMMDPEINQSRVMAQCFKEALKVEGKKFTDEEKKETYDIIDEYLCVLSNEKTPANIIGVEENFAIDIRGVATLNGMIDRIQIDPDGITHVIDYKSSKSMKYYEDDVFQLQVYGFVLMTKKPELQKIRGSYMFLKHHFAMITKDFNREEIMKIGPKIIDYVEQMKAEKEFKANPSFLCNYCGYLDNCEEGKAATLPKIHKTGQTSWV